MIKAGGFIMTTAVVFGSIAGQNRRAWPVGRFWILFVVALAAHVLLLALLSKVAQEWRVSYFLPMLVIETPLINALLPSKFKHLRAGSNQKVV